MDLVIEPLDETEADLVSWRDPEKDPPEYDPRESPRPSIT